MSELITTPRDFDDPRALEAGMKNRYETEFTRVLNNGANILHLENPGCII